VSHRRKGQRVASSQEWSLAGHAGRLVGRTWSGEGDPTSVVLLVHGYGEHIGRYEHVAEALVADGAAVVGVDHLGHGRSEGEQVLMPDAERVVDDLHAVDQLAREQHPGLPVVLVGHSMGGLLGARYAQRYGDSLAAVVLSGPVVGARQPILGLLQLPQMPDDPLDPAALSRDPSVGETYQADPLVWHGPFKRPTVEAMARGIAAVDDGPTLEGMPLLWAHGEDDPLVSAESAREAVERLSGGSHVERIYPGARHEIFNETNRDEVLADVRAFLRDALARRG
jgi:alpha-beta hydrolase superfamily lysophospholipase